MLIKIDVDGVIRDIITPMLKLYNDLFGTKLVQDDVKEYDVEKVFTLINNVFDCDAKTFFFDHNSNFVFLKGADIFNGVKESIDRLRDNGHTVVITTYQPLEKNKQDTVAFLSKFNINYDALCFTKEKHLINADILIDDNPEFLEKEAKDVLKVCINAPYNKDYSGQNSIRFDSLYDFVNYFGNDIHVDMGKSWNLDI